MDIVSNEIKTIPDMPEESTIGFQRALDLLEDPIMEKPLARSQYYKEFIEALENDTNISLSLINRILALCAVELQDDKKYCFLAMKITTLILKKIKVYFYLPIYLFLYTLLC